MRNNLTILMAHKATDERRRINTNTLAAELKERGVSRGGLYAFASDKMTEYPRGLLQALMTYFDCGINDLFIVEEVQEVTE